MDAVSVRFVKPGSTAEAASDSVRVLEARVGRSLMQAAVAAGIAEIEAECGGVLTCGTCHVFIREPHFGMMAAPSTDEEQMLLFTATPRRANSRLSCQVIVTPQMNGMVVDLPATQY